MPTVAKQSQRAPRSKPKALSRRRLEAPRDILAAAHDHAVLSDDGQQLAIPSKAGVTLLDLSGGETRCYPREIPLPSLVDRVVLGPDGAVFALCTTGGQASVHRVGETDATCLLNLPLPVRDLVATRDSLVVATAAEGLEQAAVWTFDRESGRLQEKEPLRRPARLRRVGRDAILIREGGTGSMRYVDPRQRQSACDPNSPPGRDPREGRPSGDPEPNRPPDRGKPCGCHAPCGPGPQPPQGQPDPNRPPPRRPVPPTNSCVPGEDGEGDGCLIYVRVGSSVVVRNICTPGQDACGQELGFQVARLHKAGRALAAVSEDGRDLALLAQETLQPLASLSLPSGATPLFARDSDAFLMLEADGSLEVFDPTPFLPDLELDLQTDTGGLVVYESTESPLNWERGGVQVDPVKVLVVPVMEPGQGAFQGSPLEYFAHIDFDTSFNLVRDYYREVSYSDAGREAFDLDISFEIFGRDTDAVYAGPPVLLDEPFREYWNLGYIPGGVRAESTLPTGSTLAFDGDERLTLETVTAVSSANGEIEVACPAATFRVNIPASSSGYVLDFGGPGAPLRTFSLAGTDRMGNPFSVLATSASLSTPETVTIPKREDVRDALETLADLLEEMLPSSGNPLGAPRLYWHDEEEGWGQLSVSFFFTGNGGSPQVDIVDFANLFQPGEFDELVEIAPLFDMSTSAGEEDFADYLSISLAQAMASEAGVFDPARGIIDLGIFQEPLVSVDGADLTVTIWLAPDYAYSLDKDSGEDDERSRIEIADQTGLAKIGMTNATPLIGENTKLSGSGRPTVKDANLLFDTIFTRMIDAIVAQGPEDEQTRIDLANSFFNSDGLDDTACAEQGLHHLFLFIPVYARPGAYGPPRDPDIDEDLVAAPGVRGLRAFAKSTINLNDDPADYGDPALNRQIKAKHISRARGKTFTRMRFGTPADPTLHIDDAGVIAHEFGHALLSWVDHYRQGEDRAELQGFYARDYDLMASTSTGLPHFSSYHKLAGGWLGPGSIIDFQRPPDGQPITREIVLVHLEGWDPANRTPLFDIARNRLGADDLEIGAAALFRLGANSTQFNLLELRAPGPRFSQSIATPRLVMLNAIDPRDTTRYGLGLDDPTTPEDEGASADSALSRYRRHLHLIDDSVEVSEAAGGSGDGTTYDVGTHPALAEAGLSYTLVDLISDSVAGRMVWFARVRVEWSRMPAIDIGFDRNIPEWQSADIAVLRPGEFTPGIIGDLPDPQDPQGLEYFRVPDEGDDPLEHQVLVRVYNFGDAEALEVEVNLIGRRPYGTGDWTSDVFANDLPLEPVRIPSFPAGASTVVAFSLFVSSVEDAHICLRAEIGDRDHVSGASNDRNPNNDWAQQNVLREEVVKNSPLPPVERMISVTNDGPYAEDVHLAPRHVPDGVTVTISPKELRVRPRSRAHFRVRAVLDDSLLDLRCGKDVPIIFDTFRLRDHSWDPWGAVKLVYQPRLGVSIDLAIHLVPSSGSGGVRLLGSVSPDIGGADLTFHVVFPNAEPLWTTLPLGPAATFDHLIEGTLEAGDKVFATAYFDGNDDYASARSKTVSVTFQVPG
ncbi:MAG: hypothetical protein AAFY02_09965 [Pseudomonadota bacterium]